MIAWLLLVVAIGANITSNTMFKFAMRDFPAEPTLESLLRFAFNPFLWAGGLACVVLLGCYLLALRDIALVVSYVFVISLSMVGIGLVSALVFGETISLQAGLGMALVVAGVSLIAMAGDHRPADREIAERRIEQVVSHGNA